MSELTDIDMQWISGASVPELKEALTYARMQQDFLYARAIARELIKRNNAPCKETRYPDGD